MKLASTKTQKFIEGVSLILMILMIGFTVFYWQQAPSTLPLHYNLEGAIDRWGNKNELILVPILGLFIYLLVSCVERFPNIWNIPISVTENNRIYVYQETKTMIKLLKLELIIVFFLITIGSLQGKSTSIFALLFIPILFITLIFFLIKIGKTATKYK